MALPVQLKTARMTNATLGSSIDDNVGDIEKALADLFGAPVDTNLTAAWFEVVAGGLKSLILQDAAADPATVGWIRRNGARLKFHDGTRANDLVVIPGGGAHKVGFQQAAVPTGWTRVVDAANTEAVPMLRLNGETPGAGGSWNLTGLSAPAHTHQTFADTTGGDSNPSVPLVATPGGTVFSLPHTHVVPSMVTTSAAPAIASDTTWRPKYVDWLVGSKD